MGAEYFLQSLENKNGGSAALPRALGEAEGDPPKNAPWGLVSPTKHPKKPPWDSRVPWLVCDGVWVCVCVSVGVCVGLCVGLCVQGCV